MWPEPKAFGKRIGMSRQKQIMPRLAALHRGGRKTKQSNRDINKWWSLKAFGSVAPS
jgi:hypothetical protein